MYRKMLPLWVCLSLPLFACADSSSAQRPSEDAARRMPIMKSSLVVLLEHRGELALTDEQVAWLEKRDKQLEEENAPLKKKLEESRPQGGGGGGHWGGGGGHRGGMGGGMGGMGGGRMGGGGMGGGMMGGGMGGGRMGGGGMGGGDSDREARQSRMAQMRSAMREIQDNDTRAYNDAEQQLTDAQKPKARELISQEREKFLKEREAMRQQMGG